MARKKERFTDLTEWLQRVEQAQLLTEVGPKDNWLNAVDERGDVLGQWLPDEECRVFGVRSNGWLFV